MATPNILFRDRAIGALLGLAVGDAIGTTLEFSARDSYEHITDMIGYGPFDLRAGEWTDDTSMALALADSLNANPMLDEYDLMKRFENWFRKGENSCTGDCFDIGITTRNAILKWSRFGNPIAGDTDPRSAGNGSLMRLAPVAIRHWNHHARLADIAARQSLTTHGAPESVDACIAFGLMLGDAIRGEKKESILSPQTNNYAGNVKTILEGGWRHKTRDEISSSGYVVHSLESALWCVDRTTSFADAVLLAANLGDDADTTAAITGQLAGAIYGASHIPNAWLGKLAWKDHIERTANQLFTASLSHTPTSNPTLSL